MEEQAVADRSEAERQRHADFEAWLEYLAGKKLPHGQRKAMGYVDALTGPGPTPPLSVFRSALRQAVDADWWARVDENAGRRGRFP